MKPFKRMINKLIKKNTFKEVISYVSASTVLYILLFSGLFILIDILNVNASISFFIIYALVYPLSYICQKLIFKNIISSNSVIKFILHILVFMFLSNITFNILLFLHLHYFLCSFITIAILFPMRFISSKYIVFRNK